jgi:hypothetical protein
MFFTCTVRLVAASVLTVFLVVGRPAQAQTISQWADKVLGFSTQYSPNNWSAEQTLGPPNTTSYGDRPTAWAPSYENGTLEYVTVGFLDPVYATGVTVRENLGNGFVTKVDVVDASDTLHTVWTGTDPSAPGALADFTVTWTRTAYTVKGVKIYVNTSHNLNTWEEIDAIQLHGIPIHYGQWASRVTGFSSQYYSTGGYSAAQALGPPDTFSYGDIGTAWASAHKDGTQEFLQLDYDTPVYATGVTVRETDGNGFVTRIDVVDSGGVLHTVWTGTDLSQPGLPVDAAFTWAKTAFLVKGVKVYVDTSHSTTWEEVDAVRLYGDPPPGIAGTVLLQACPNLTASLTFELRPTSGGTALTRTRTLSKDGSFVISDVPADDYNLAIKGSMWLRKVVPADASSGGAYGIVATLRTGDINNDNKVNIADLGLLADSFGRNRGEAGFNPNADLNCDGKVNIADLGLLADNFGKTGDP